MRSGTWGCCLAINPKATRISELLRDLDHRPGRLTPGSGSNEQLLWLVSKLATEVFEKCRAFLERKSRVLTYEDLSVFPAPEMD